MVLDAVRARWPSSLTVHADIAAIAGEVIVKKSSERIEHPIRVCGRSPEHLVAHAVQLLLAVLGEPARGEGGAGSVVTFQASGGTMEVLLQSLAVDVLNSVEASSTGLADAEVSHVMKTDEGLRAWGYLRFGTEPSLDHRTRVGDGVSVATLPDGGFELRISLLGGAVEPPANPSDKR